MAISTEFVTPPQLNWSSMPQPSSRILRSSLVDGALAPQTWQTLILPHPKGSGPSLRGEQVNYARFDSPHKSTPDPWMLTQWVEDIGWHRPITAIETPEQLLGSLIDEGAKRNAAAAIPGAGSVGSFQPSVAIQQPNSLAKSRLNQLLAEAAHDIRSPIAVAQQILHSLSQRAAEGAPLTETESELLSQASLRLTQAHQWAEGILLERSLEHGQPVNVRRRFYPSQWQLGIEPLLKSLALQRRVQLQWNGWDRSLPRLYLDPTHLSRIVLNLVTNALQASPPNSRVKLQVAWLTHITQHLVLTIEDQGAGLPADRLAQINASAMWPKETNESLEDGLGLRTAKILARSLGGTLAAQVSHAGGTQFTLSLPVDNYHSLIRSWLRQNAEFAELAPRNERHTIAVHAVRFSMGATPTDCADQANELLTQIDSRFQQTAEMNDLVYRVAQDRWLWLSLTPTTKPLAGKVADRSSTPAAPLALEETLGWVRQISQAQSETITCRYQQVFRIEDVSLSNCVGTHSSQHNLLTITTELAEKFAELIGDNIPPVDELAAPQWFGIRRPKVRGAARHLRIDTARKLAPPASSSGPRVGAAIVDTPCDAFSGTLAELSQQWHIRQRQLERAHRALNVR